MDLVEHVDVLLCCELNHRLVVMTIWVIFIPCYILALLTHTSVCQVIKSYFRIFSVKHRFHIELRPHVNKMKFTSLRINP